MEYRAWHPMVVAIAAIAAQWIPEPWRSLLATAAILFCALTALLLVRQARRLVDDAQRIRTEAMALAAQVDAYRDQMINAVDRAGGPPAGH